MQRNLSAFCVKLFDLRPGRLDADVPRMPFVRGKRREKADRRYGDRSVDLFAVDRQSRVEQRIAMHDRSFRLIARVTQTGFELKDVIFLLDALRDQAKLEIAVRNFFDGRYRVLVFPDGVGSRIGGTCG